MAVAISATVITSFTTGILLPAGRLRRALDDENARCVESLGMTSSVHSAACDLRAGRSAMPRQQTRRLTRRTELEHRGQHRFQNHLLLHATAADRRKPGNRFQQIVQCGARLPRRQRDKTFADETQRRRLRIGGIRNIDRADRGRINPQCSCQAVQVMARAVAPA